MKDSHDYKTGDSEQAVTEERRKFLKKAGKFALYTPPAVMILMKPSFAGNRCKGSWLGRPRGNNGIGNGIDGQPPGSPKPNDTAGIWKGHRPHQEDR